MNDEVKKKVRNNVEEVLTPVFELAKGSAEFNTRILEIATVNDVLDLMSKLETETEHTSIKGFIGWLQEKDTKWDDLYDELCLLVQEYLSVLGEKEDEK